MKFLILLALSIACLNIEAKEFILEVSHHGFIPQKKIINQFQVMGRKFLVLKQEDIPSSPTAMGILGKYENHATYLLKKDFDKQWGLDNQGKNEPITPDRMSPVGSKVGVDIKALKAWTLTKGSSDIKIAIVDTGLDLSHPELAPNLWRNEAEANGLPGVDDDQNGFIDDIHGYDFTGNKDGHPQDENGHGTHCAGIIGSSHSAGKILGVMDKVSMMALRTLDKKGAGKLDQAVEAFGYAIENGAQIISNSWGSRGHSQLLEDLIIEAQRRGIIVVAAAGNSRYNDNDINATYPANYPGVISVSSVNARGRHASYSSYGKTMVHLGAPGTNILSSHTLKKGLKYRVLSGTSMAAPFVTGAVGLYLSLHGGNQNPESIKQKLIDTSMKLDHLKGMNQAEGMLDAYSFLQSGF